MKVSGTFDIECASWDRFAVAATYRPGRGKQIHRTIGSLLDAMLAIPKSTWWAHAGGAFDFLAIAEEFRRRGISVAMDLAGSRVSRLCGAGITLRDSWPLVPMPLKVAAELGATMAPILGLPCICGGNCEGYCSIQPNDPRACVADYCAEDARVLFDVLLGVRDVAIELNLELKGTLGGTAWATAKRDLDLPNAELPSKVWGRARQAYFGGRITIVRPRAEGPGTHWDLSSAYPAALASTSLPCGEWTPYTGSDAHACFANDRPGIYHVKVTVPEMLFPPLPLRAAKRINYPWGTFRGAWTFSELQAAMERGVSIDEVLWCVVWDHEEKAFAPLIRHWWDARAKAGKASALGQWLRLLPNSIGGKLAESPERWTARLFPETVQLCKRKRRCRDGCTGTCGAWDQLDLWGDLWAVPFFRPSTSGHVQWAAYMTAAVREQWLGAAEKMGKDVVYGHTDSLWTTSPEPPSPHGTGLGEWSYKHDWHDFECAGPSVYRYRDTALPDGDTAFVVKAAGATLTSKDWLAGGMNGAKGVMPLAEAAATGKGLFVRKPVVWTLPTRGKETGRYGDRVLDADERVTLPMAYGEIEKESSRVSQGR